MLLKKPDNITIQILSQKENRLQTTEEIYEKIKKQYVVKKVEP
jgi:hypothetical protein